MDSVVLLHGLWRSRWSMVLPYWRLRAAGFHVVGIDYPSRSRPIEELARHVAERLPDAAAAGRLHFLTHSLGGLVTRHLIRTRRPANLGRVVMLSPPNQGSHLARRLQRSRFMRAAAGPIGPLLTSAPGEVATLLGPVDFDLGIIAGDTRRSVLSGWFEGPSDGRVTVDEARVEGMADLLVVPRGHAFIMNDPRVIDQAIHFLRHGQFRRDAG